MRHVFEVAGVEQAVRAGWSLELTANGRDRLRVDFLSPTGTYAPDMDDEVFLYTVFGILSAQTGNPAIFETEQPHQLVTGDVISIAGHVGSTPDVNGTDYTVTVISEYQFSIPVNVTVAGSGGEVFFRTFGGNVGEPEKMSGDGEGAGPAVLTVAECADFNAMAERRFVKEILTEATLKDMLTILVDNYLTDCTLHPDQVDGPTLGQQTYDDWTRLDEVLNSLSTVSGGYVWQIDAYKRLRMRLPSTVAAPFNVVGGAEVYGTPRIRPTRQNYANRIILKFSAAARAAVAYLIAEPSPGVINSGNFANGDTVTIDSKVYTFQTTLTDVDGNVKIGADKVASLRNLTRAIGASTKTSHGPGVNYANATTVHPTVVAAQATYFGTLRGMRVRAKVAGAAGNSITVAETSANAYWRTSVGVDTHLLDGSDQELTNVTMAEDTAAQAAPTGIWEKVVEAPDILDIEAADITAAAVLVASLVTPINLIFDTQRGGLRPGQTMSIALAKYGVSGTFLITDVSVRHREGELMIYSVTAVEDTLLQAADRWRDFWKQALGVSTGGNVQVGAVQLSPPAPVGVAASTLITFGGDDIAWRRTPSGWVDANSIERELSPVTHGANYTMKVRLRARSGSVTARLYNETTATAVGTSAAVTNTNFQTVAFSVTLDAAGIYKVQLSSSVANEQIQLGSAYMEKV